MRGWSPPGGSRHRAAGLEVRRLGDRRHGPVMVLLHGLTASGDWWGGAYDALGGIADVVVPDLLGYGRSMDRQRDQFSRAQHLSTLDEMLSELGLDGRPLIVVGHSMGGTLALHWGARRSETTAVLAFSAPLYDDEEEGRQHIERLGPLERLFALDTSLAAHTCAAMCRYRAVAQWLWTAAAPRVPVRIARHGVLHTWPAYRDGMADLILRSGWREAMEVLADREVPVVLANGDADPVPVEGRADALAATLRYVEAFAQPHASHGLPASHPEWCVERIRSMCQGSAAGRSAETGHPDSSI